MASYTRQSTFSDGDLITAALFNNEYNQLVDAFNNVTGHKHDGTVGEGPVIGLIGDAGVVTPLNKILVDTTNDHIEFWIDVSGTSTQQFYVADGAIVPVTDNDVDLGTSSLQFKDLYINGTANIDSLVADTVDINGGTIDGVTIGGSSAGAITGTTITGTSFVIGSASINETELEILDGATLTTTELNYVDGVTSSIQTQLNTKAPLSSPSLTGIPTAPTASANTNTTQVATTAYVQTEITDLIGAAPGTLDTLNELAAAINDDANYNTTLTTALATKLPLAGGTMTGDVTYSDNVKAQFGTSQDLQIYHDGSHSYISENGTGNLILKGGGQILLKSPADENMIVANGNGAVNLFYDNAAKLATTSTGIDVTGVITTDGLTTSADINFGDDDKAIFGTGSDLQIYHDGSNSNIVDTGTGYLSLRGTDLRLQDSSGWNFVICTDLGQGGEVALLHSNIQKLKTTSTGIDVTGAVTSDGLTVGANDKIQFGTSDITGIYRTNSGSDFTMQHWGNLSMLIDSDNNDSGTRQFMIGRNSQDASTATKIALFSEGGDISFYEDTGTTAKLFWDASAESLGIGTTSPMNTLSIKGSVNQLDIETTTSGVTMESIDRSDLNAQSDLSFYARHGEFKFFGSSYSERARIDSSGNLLVGTTSGGNSSAGFRAYSGGNGAFTIAGTTLSLNRLSSNGEILNFQKDTVNVGSIGVGGSNKMTIIGTNANLQLGANNTALLNLDTNKFYPQTDNSVDLGFNSSAGRFRDLYLTGTANFGSLSDGTITITGFADEDNMSSNSATLVPTQQSVKAYVDSQVSSAGGNGISFEDNEKAQFGASNDLQIYHDGSNSYIKENGTGNLYLAGTSLVVSNSVGANYLVAYDGGSVNLYHNANQKLATTSSGIDVTGTVTSDGLTVDGADVFFNSGWIKSNSSLRIDIDNDNNQTDRAFFISHGNASKDIFKASENGDISFYDDTGSTQGFFWDSSAESLGIGTTAPSAALHISGTSANQIRLERTNHDTFRIGLQSAVGLGFHNVTDNRTDMMIKGDGNVGIGTSSPSTTLELSNGFNAPILRLSNENNSITAGGDLGVIEFYSGDNSNSGDSVQASLSVIQPTTDNVSGEFVFKTSNAVENSGALTERLRIAKDGSVGIGTTSPTSPLHVVGTITADTHFTSSDTNTTLSTSGSGGTVRLRPNGLSSTTGQVTVVSSGNVGIGTDSPDTKMHISDTSGNAIIRLERNDNTISTNDIYGEIQFEGQDASAASAAGVRGKILGVSEGTTGQMAIAFHTANSYSPATEALRIDSSQKVGIGITSPTSPLTVKSNSTGSQDAGFTLQANGSTNAIFKVGEKSNGKARLHMFDGTTEKIALHTDGTASHISAGNFGIGDTSPDAKLTVQGDVLARDEFRGEVVSYAANQDAPYLIAGTSGYTGATTNWNTFGFQHRIKTDSGGSPRITIDTHIGEAFTVTNTNRVGIGTTSPTETLHVMSGVSNDTVAIISGSQSDRGLTISTYASDGRTDGGVDLDAYKSFKFTTDGTERARIDSSGNLAIGNISAAAKLDIRQDSGSAIRCEDGSGAYFVVKQGGLVGIGTPSPDAPLTVHNSSDPEIRFGYSSTQDHKIAWDSSKVFIHADPENANGSSAIGFAVDGTERARIDSSGNLGIGTDSPDALLHLSANTGATLRLESTDTAIAANEVIGAIEWEGNDATTGSSGIAGKIDVIAEDATPEYSMRFFTQDNLSGTYELAERMRIVSDGKVGIGTDSPGEKLTVGGNTLTYGSTGNVGAGASYFLGNSQNSRDIALTRVGSATLAIGYYSSGWQESARFDSSGNLLVSTTSTSPWTNSANSSSDNGIALRNDGIIAASAYKGTANSGNVAILNRTGTDGGILSFYKSGATVGSIGTVGADVTIGTGDTGLRFRDEFDAIQPHNITTNGTVDGVISLGKTGATFKDLHLSGTVNASTGYFSKSGGNNITINSTTANATFLKLQNSVRAYSVTTTYDGALSFYDNTGTSERARIDTSGNLLVGTANTFPPSDTGNEGVAVKPDNIAISRNASTPLFLDRMTSDGVLIDLRKDNVTGGVIGIQEPQDDAPEFYIANGTGSNTVGLAFWDYIQTARIAPCNGLGAYKDNYIDLGFSGARFDDIYATNGTIQTSDRNDKQDIEEITDVETRVAVACKGLIRKFRWKSAVAEKDDNSDSDETARIHFGIIAQDLQDAFTAEGLDAGDYAMFTSQTWEDSDGVEQTRLGVRYSELLAFIIAAI